MRRILKIDYGQTDQRTEMLRGKQNHRKKRTQLWGTPQPETWD